MKQARGFPAVGQPHHRPAMPLSTIFLAAAPEERRPHFAAIADFGGHLSRRVATARNEWCEVEGQRLKVPWKKPSTRSSW